MKSKNVLDLQLKNLGVLSQQEHENSRIRLLQKESALYSARSSLNESRLRIEQLNSELIGLALQERERRQQLLRQLQLAQHGLSAQLAQWDQIHVLRVPLDGRVSQSRYWSSIQHVRAGKLVMTVVPDGDRRLVGKDQLPLDGAGKVKPG